MTDESILSRQAKDLESIRYSSVNGQQLEAKTGDVLMAILLCLHRIELAMVDDDDQRLVVKLAIQRFVSALKVEKA